MERIRNSVCDMFTYWIYRGWTHATFTAFDAVQAEFHCEKLMSGFTNVKKMEKKRFPFHWFGIRKIMQINIEWKTCENTEYRLRKTNTTTNQKTRKNALSNLSNWEKMNTTFFMFFFSFFRALECSSSQRQIRFSHSYFRLPSRFYIAFDKNSALYRAEWLGVRFIWYNSRRW